jgi:predicted transcriptional regulator
MKKYIFKYDPSYSLKEMFVEFEKAIKTGEKNIQPKNISIVSQFSVINRILSKTRLELFSVIREKQPTNIQELAQLLQRDYANVWRDCQVLAGCHIIELKKLEKEIRPLALYDQIVIEFATPIGKKVGENTSLSA